MSQDYSQQFHHLNAWIVEAVFVQILYTLLGIVVLMLVDNNRKHRANMIFCLSTAEEVQKLDSIFIHEFTRLVYGITKHWPRASTEETTHLRMANRSHWHDTWSSRNPLRQQFGDWQWFLLATYSYVLESTRRRKSRSQVCAREDPKWLYSAILTLP